MPDQLNIDGGADEIRAAEHTAERMAEHTAIPLFEFPSGLRGQLAVWADDVCGPIERKPGLLDDWAVEVTDA